MPSEINYKTNRAGKVSALLAALLFFGYTSPLLAATEAQCESRLNVQATQPDINFGDMMEYGAGTVTVTPASARSATGGVVLLGGTVSAAVFRIRVNQNGCFNINNLCISVPDTPLTGPGSPMAMTNYVIDIPALGIAASLPTSIDLPNRTWVDVYIGADLPVGAGQAAGDYSATYTATFTYLGCP